MAASIEKFLKKLNLTEAQIKNLQAETPPDDFDYDKFVGDFEGQQRTYYTAQVKPEIEKAVQDETYKKVYGTFGQQVKSTFGLTKEEFEKALGDDPKNPKLKNVIVFVKERHDAAIEEAQKDAKTDEALRNEITTLKGEITERNQKYVDLEKDYEQKFKQQEDDKAAFIRQSLLNQGLKEMFPKLPIGKTDDLELYTGAVEAYLIQNYKITPELSEDKKTVTLSIKSLNDTDAFNPDQNQIWKTADEAAEWYIKSRGWDKKSNAGGGGKTPQEQAADKVTLNGKEVDHSSINAKYKYLENN